MFATLVHWFSPVEDQVLSQSTTEREFRPCDNTHRSANSFDKNQPAAISGLSHRPPSCFRLQFCYVVSENQWRAVRYGLDGKMIDFGKGKEVTTRELIRELLWFVYDVIDDLGSRHEIEHINRILRRGTSA